uniref:USP domain-containing protein n=1 Tax=Eptatretus burgeri TaxID=7764 RepID=A0A8C4QFC8_EPTBU
MLHAWNLFFLANFAAVCLCCKKVAHLYEYFYEIVLDIKDVKNVKSALQQFFSREAEAQSNMECKRCFRTLYYKTHSIHDPPNVLILVLNRFDESCQEKIEKKVKFPRMLNLKPFLTHPYKGNLMYNLYAIIVHTGEDCDKGSYHCYVKAGDTYWYKKKNEVVNETLLWAVLRQKAYILFYIRYALNTCFARQTGYLNFFILDLLFE